MRYVIGILALFALPATAAAQQSFYSHDNYTQYELLEPASHQFAITYYVTERRAGATYLLNQTRSGSEGSGIAVFDPQTGKPLKFDYMTGAELTAAGMTGRFDPAEHYIRAHLARPVPENGEGRVKILKTYKDEKSYYVEGEDIVFKRSLGIARNSIVLPKGFRLVSSNVAAQMFTLADGRLKISFEHAHDYAADVTIRARRRPAVATPGAAPVQIERAFDSSKTLYDVQFEPPLITVTREYIETLAGAEVRLQRPIGIGDEFVVTDVDSGQRLEVERRGNQAIAKLSTAIAGPDSSARLRISGPMRVNVATIGESFGFELSINSTRAVILLPAGWDVTSVSIPATVRADSDGRLAIQIYNASAGSLMVTVRAAKRSVED
jgi:hypothetical protein